MERQQGGVQWWRSSVASGVLGKASLSAYGIKPVELHAGRCRHSRQRVKASGAGQAPDKCGEERFDLSFLLSDSQG
jgi:hypothetical protein